jgi:hypothetical protein
VLPPEACDKAEDRPASAAPTATRNSSPVPTHTGNNSSQAGHLRARPGQGQHQQKTRQLDRGHQCVRRRPPVAAEHGPVSDTHRQAGHPDHLQNQVGQAAGGRDPRGGHAEPANARSPVRDLGVRHAGHGARPAAAMGPQGPARM